MSIGTYDFIDSACKELSKCKQVFLLIALDDTGPGQFKYAMRTGIRCPADVQRLEQIIEDVLPKYIKDLKE